MKTKTINNIAEITLLFWLIKIIATTLGETLGDFISMALNLGYSTGILITSLFFIILLFIQLKVKNYNPITFWLVIIASCAKFATLNQKTISANCSSTLNKYVIYHEKSFPYSSLLKY